MNSRKNKIISKGFTLVEVLLVISILAILAVVTIIAINPARHMAKARDSERSADIYYILSALHQYAVDHSGSFPKVITTDKLEICRTDSDDCNGLYELSILTDNQEYMVSIPTDPLCATDSFYCSENGSGYFLSMAPNGKITVSAPNAEIENDILVTR